MSKIPQKYLKEVEEGEDSCIPWLCDIKDGSITGSLYDRERAIKLIESGKKSRRGFERNKKVFNSIIDLNKKGKLPNAEKLKKYSSISDSPLYRALKELLNAGVIIDPSMGEIFLVFGTLKSNYYEFPENLERATHLCSDFLNSIRSLEKIINNPRANKYYRLYIALVEDSKPIFYSIFR